MNCPYCGKEMQKGAIFTGQALEWRHDNGDTNRAMWDRVRLCKLGWDGAELESDFCPDCRILIMPVPEVEAPLDAVKNKLKGLMNRSSGNKKEKSGFHGGQGRKRETETENKRPVGGLKNEICIGIP